jgi:hypothetical protein
MIVRLTHLDGKLPNLALMKLAHFHRERGDDVVFTKRPRRDFLEPAYGRVYASAIFSKTSDKVAQLRQDFPDAIVGGTWNVAEPITVEAHLGVDAFERFDYSIYPGFDASIGFTQRGCRLKCGFCVVPKKEGAPRSVSTIADLWRGGSFPKHVHLLDNDFFGQPREQWQARIDEIRAGGFRVCLNQGINVRLLDEDAAAALASIPYYDDAFRERRLYTAWDNVGDEDRFFRGIDMLERHGVSPTHVMAYMLVGYDKRETWERVMYRLRKMIARGVRPYPMIYGDKARTLPLGGCNEPIAAITLGFFSKWVIRRACYKTPLAEYNPYAKTPDADQLALFDEDDDD